jgi:hypothetical protein
MISYCFDMGDERKRTLGRHTCRWLDNIKIDFEE